MKAVQNRNARTIILVLLISLSAVACSIQDYAIDMISDAITGGGGTDAFMSDNDPELVGDALPLAIKLYETLLSQNPDHPGLRITTGSLYIMYANAFLQTPANYLPPEAFLERQFALARAKNLYIRGRDFLLEQLDMNHPGFEEAVLSGEGLDEMLEQLGEDDVQAGYWLTAGWFGAISIDTFDLELAFRIPQVIAVIERIYEINPDYNNGAIDELFIQVYAAIPASMGGSREAAREYFARAVEKQNGSSAGPYVSLASAVSLPEQNLEEFTMLMNTALEIDPDQFPENRLLNTITQRRAQWYLDNIDQFFIF